MPASKAKPARSEHAPLAAFPAAQLLTRRQMAEAFTQHGFPIKASTLAALAMRGEGPPHSKWGRFALYPWSSALEWAQRRLMPSGASQQQAPAKSRKQRAHTEAA